MEMYAYIDEAGDDGIGGKGTKWFVMTAVITNQEEASTLGYVYQRIRQRIDLKENKPLHWSEFSHLRKKAIIEELINSSFSFCSVLVDTQHPDIVNTSPKLGGRRLYFYTFRRLVERLTWYCDDRGYKVRLYPENKAGIKYEELKGYLDYIQRQPDCEIRKGCILEVQPKAKTQSNLIQLADCVCGALYNAVEHKYGVIEDAYLLMLKEKLYKHDNKLFGYGLKFMPHKSALIPQILSGTYEWLNKI
ncbi:MAG: DUF3800 domain-containing protein [Dehalococcoidales bacterium]|nr:DUF3800 domain-containing protein [Dehalococcoidales bacterium]